MESEERRYRVADIAEHVGVSVNEVNDWLAGEQGHDYPKPEGHDDEGPYWRAYHLSDWDHWFEAG
jgi:hypothetical protein